MKCQREEWCVLVAPHTGRCFGGLLRDCDNCARKINAGRLCHWCATARREALLEAAKVADKQGALGVAALIRALP